MQYTFHENWSVLWHFTYEERQESHGYFIGEIYFLSVHIKIDVITRDQPSCSSADSWQELRGWEKEKPGHSRGQRQSFEKGEKRLFGHSHSKLLAPRLFGKVSGEPITALKLRPIMMQTHWSLSWCHYQLAHAGKRDAGTADRGMWQHYLQMG